MRVPATLGKLWIVVLGLLVSSLLIPDPALTLPVRVGIYQNSPKIYLDEKGRPAGFFPEILNHIAAREGWRLEYVPCAWAKCLEAGTLDLMPDVAWSEERETGFDFTSRVILANWSRVYAQPGNRIKSILDLDGKKVAVVEGSIQARKLSQDAQAYSIIPHFIKAKSFAAVFDLIAKKKVDAGITNRLSTTRHRGNRGVKQNSEPGYRCCGNSHHCHDILRHGR